MTKVAVYARYSSDLQTDASIEDQIRVVEEKAQREGWKIVQRYTDHGISGASMMRPGIQMLMQDAAAGKFDIVLAEAMDRLSRDQEDIAGIFKRMQFAGVKIITLSEGEVSHLHIGLKGTMNALFLKDLADKTRRGMRGRVENGKAGGGITYGYDVVRRLDGNGELIRGERKINEGQAKVVNRIFKEYVAGRSPKAIAHQLNKESIPGPNGGAWGPSTIYGNRERGTGIINNELYIGRMIWNRLRYVKDPDTGKRVSRLNPEDQWIKKDVPEMRIVDQALWERTREKQGAISKQHKEFWGKQRPKYLFSQLIKCGCCGGGVSKVSGTALGCSTARNKGTCDNLRTIPQAELEHSVLHALKAHLMDPALCEVFCEEYARHMNELRIEQSSQRASYEAELKKRKRDEERMIQMVIDGFASISSMKEKVNTNNARILELEELLKDHEVKPVLLHPNMGTHYQKEVRRLIVSLNNAEHRGEAGDLIRGLVEKIVLMPKEDGKGLTVDLHGDLAGILTMAANKPKPLTDRDELVQQVKMVAGVGFEPTTFRL